MKNSCSRRRLSTCNITSALAVAGLAGVFLVGACTPSTTTPDATPTETVSESVAPTPTGEEAPENALSANEFAVEDAWVKASDGMMDMVGSFGILKNLTGEDLHIVSATSDFSERTELHEMVGDGSGSMKMTEMPDGLIVPAKGESVLMPGGNHIMIMEMPKALEAGKDVTITLHFSNGKTFSYIASARTFDGGNEEYVEGGMDHGNMDHGNMDHGDENETEGGADQ